MRKKATKNKTGHKGIQVNKTIFMGTKENSRNAKTENQKHIVKYIQNHDTHPVARLPYYQCLTGHTVCVDCLDVVLCIQVALTLLVVLVGYCLTVFS